GMGTTSSLRSMRLLSVGAGTGIGGYGADPGAVLRALLPAEDAQGPNGADGLDLAGALGLVLRDHDQVVVANRPATEVDLDRPAVSLQALAAQRGAEADELLALDLPGVKGAERVAGQLTTVIDDRGRAVGAVLTLRTLRTLRTDGSDRRVERSRIVDVRRSARHIVEQE